MWCSIWQTNFTLYWYSSAAFRPPAFLTPIPCFSLQDRFWRPSDVCRVLRGVPVISTIAKILSRHGKTRKGTVTKNTINNPILTRRQRRGEISIKTEYFLVQAPRWNMENQEEMLLFRVLTISGRKVRSEDIRVLPLRFLKEPVKNSCGIITMKNP